MELIFTMEKLLWSGPLLLILMGSHLYFTVKLRGIQRYTLRGIGLSLAGERLEGRVSPFGAMATSLAAAIGTGNIIGMASAVALGGPGAVFWCWVTGILGMATRYGETVLTFRYRKRLENGTWTGGPMYVMELGLKKPWLGRLFSFLGIAAALGTGAMIQANAVGTCLWELGVHPLLTGILLTGASGAVILGGVKSIASFCEKLVPAMGGAYLLGCMGVLFVNRGAIGEALWLIVSGAFTARSIGGGVLGGTFMTALRYGTARGLFTNEAGMGTGPMAAAAGPCRSPETEGLSAMTGVFWDTVVICAMTGLALVSAMVSHPEDFAGVGAEGLCSVAFSGIFGGRALLTLCLCIFAFATVVGWSWYGECCTEYLLGSRWVMAYRLLYLASAFCGVFLQLDVLWSLGGILAGLMAAPNVFSLWKLRREIVGGNDLWCEGEGR